MTDLYKLIGPDMLGGWIRAAVAALLAVSISRWPLLGTILNDPTVQQALGVVIAGIAVGLWSQLTKTDSAKLAATEALPEVKKILVVPTTVGMTKVADDPARPKIVTP